MKPMLSHAMAFGLGGLVVLLYVGLRPPGDASPGAEAEHATRSAASEPTRLHPVAAAEPSGRSRGVEPHCTDDANTSELEERVEQLEAQLAAKDLEQATRGERSDEVTYFNLSRQEQLELARNCDVRSDIPGSLSKQAAEDLGMSPDEHAIYDRVLAQWRSEHHAREIALYREVAGEDPPSHPSAMIEALLKTATPEDRELPRKIAEERAGLRAPPDADDALGLYERHMRLSTGQGDEFEQRLARELGAGRARELRAAGDGWPGGRSRRSGCPEPGTSP